MSEDILLRSCNESYPVQTMCQARIQLPFMTEDVLLIVAADLVDLRMVFHCLFITVHINASFCATSFFKSLPKNC